MAVHRRFRPHWRAGTAGVVLCLLLAPCLTAAIEDRREAVAQESQRYRAQHFPNGHMPPKHVWSQPSSAQPAVGESREVPGGVGYGYYFNNAALLWTNCSIADYYVIAPTFLGGTVSYLYLTSTCRAQLGTESFVAYYTTSEAQFWIYDWSLLPANPWAVSIDLPTSNPQYLTMRPDEFDVMRQMIHVRNGTYYLGSSNGLYNWQNQTLLFNFARGGWDYIYSHNYTTTTLAGNLPGATGEPTGYWGPIVETFDTYTNVNPVGFDLIRLFQDGNANPTWLTPSNSYVQSTTSWTLLTQATNTSFTVAVGSNVQVGGPINLGSLCVTANNNAASFSLSPPVGSNSLNWIITPNSNRWDKTVVGLPPGPYTVTFSPGQGNIAPAPQVFTIATNTITTVQASYILAPVLLSGTVLGQSLLSTWGVQTNSSYQLQISTNLAQTTWSNLGNPFLATNATVTTSNSLGPAVQWFCRLMLLQ
jgi:hypothetical protein